MDEIRLEHWFPVCAPWILRDRRTAPRRSV